MLDVIGWVGSILFAICAIPQAWKCHKQGHSEGLDWVFLLCWLGGEILVTIYVIPKRDWPLIFNYVANLTCVAVIVWYKARPRTQAD